MKTKINIFTLLIFAYSIVVCITCKRDFSGEYEAKTVSPKKIQPVTPAGNGIHSDQVKTVQSSSFRISRN